MSITPLPQKALIERLRRACQQDERLVAAMLYGSWSLGEADRWSDVDCLLYFADEALPAIDPRAWLSQLVPLLLCYRNEFGVVAAIFEDLVRGEFHFDPASRMSQLETFQGVLSFPSPASTILVDRTGELARHLGVLLGPPDERATPANVEHLADSLCNWVLFGTNVLARGEHARALEILNVLHDHLLRMARLLEGTTAHWITPTRALEQDLSAEAYARFRACTAALDPEALRGAYLSAWEWGAEMLARLAERHAVALPSTLMASLDARLTS